MKVGTFDIEKAGQLELSDEKGPNFGKRHVQVILLFFLVVSSSCTRLNLPVGIDAMTDENYSENSGIPTYNWENKRVILTSFYWGYGILQVLGAQMGRIYGIKGLLATAMAVNSIVFLLIPPVAEEYGSTGVIVCRVIQGLAQGFFYPYIQSLIGQWIPPTERLKCCVLALSGTPLSNIITLFLTTYISSTSYGWPLTFYVYGVFGFVWIISWLLLGSNSPEEYNSITKGEKFFIENSLGIDENTKFAKTPWKKILTCLPVWAAIIAYLGQTWGNIIIQMEIPTYMTEIMKLDIATNTFLASAPYISTFLMSFVFCYIASYLIFNKYVTKLFARKLFTTIGLVVPALVVIALGFLPENAKVWSFVLLIIAAGASSAMYSGHSANIFDLSPTFPGIIKGISNSITNIFNILPPFTVQVIVTDESERNYWRTIFIMSMVFYISTNIFYFLFASGDLESWDPTSEKVKNSPEKNKTTLNK